MTPDPTPTVTDHDFLPVAGHPDDNECTYRNDGTDLTYCGEPKEAHDAPTPQPAHDHGAAGFCTDHAQPVADGRTETVAGVLREHQHRAVTDGHVTHYSACTCGWWLDATGPDRAAHQAAAVVAALGQDGAGFWPALAGQNDRDAWAFMAERDAARDESARLRASADAWWTEYDRELTAHEATKAEVERLTRIVNGYDRTPAERTDDDH